MPRDGRPGLVRVVGHSMEPALRPGDLVLVGRAAGRPRRGDIVVLDHPSGARYVKRVAGVEGDAVELEAGRLRVNGRSVDGRPRIAGAVVARWTVPTGAVFVTGDNAAVSDDSRTWDQPYVRVRTTRRVWTVLPNLVARARSRPKPHVLAQS